VVELDDELDEELLHVLTVSHTSTILQACTSDIVAESPESLQTSFVEQIFWKQLDSNVDLEELLDELLELAEEMPELEQELEDEELV
jgi:5-bromo-4-chloroindolyl phosphate hydrolysis protein